MRRGTDYATWGSCGTLAETTIAAESINTDFMGVGALTSSAASQWLRRFLSLCFSSILWCKTKSAAALMSPLYNKYTFNNIPLNNIQ